MPGPAVTELVRLVGQAEPATRVLLLAEDAHLGPPGQAGPAGMTRAVSARELAQAIRAVAAGLRVVAADPPAGHGSPKPHGSPTPRDHGAPEREGSRQPEGARTAVHTPGTDAVHTPGTDAVHTPGEHAVHSPEPTKRDHHAELLLRSLSARERQVLALLARGYSNRRIAEACYLSLNTVRTHVQNVLVKLGVHSKLEAAALAVRQGLVRIEDHPA
jgi:DNA-binding NarL/FixJ family response regulator